MTQKISTQVARAAFCLASCLLVAVATQGQQSGEGIVRINGGGTIVALHSGPQKIERSAADPASLVRIYSDLGTGTTVYLPNIGWSVSGPGSGAGQAATATPFTPKGNFNLVLIRVAILTVSGTNGVTLSLNRDDNDSPGTAIRIWNLVNLPQFAGCCKLDQAKLKKPFEVKKGVQYWLVATTDSTTQDANDSWNMNSRSIFGTVAQQINNGPWQVTKNSALLPAFSVLGTPVN
jgi:hypothetical protein